MKTWLGSLVVLILAACVVAPRSAQASLIQFDFTTTLMTGHDQLGYATDDPPVLRGRVVFDTSAFEAASFNFFPNSSGSLVLSTLSASGDNAIAQADFWIDEHLMWSGSNLSASMGYQRQGQLGGFDGGWAVDLGSFSFGSIDGAAPTGAVPLSEFGKSGDPIADFLLNFDKYGSYWMASMDGFNRSLGGGHGEDPNETFSVHMVPEPSALGVFVLALGWMLVSNRKRRARTERQ